ncbi:MAG: transglutaminase-like domain-containing protein [Bacteroidota bacterium]
MSIGKVHSLKKMLFQLILLVVPTVVFICFILWRLNNYYTILQNEWLTQGLYFASGCIASLMLFRYRFRFVTSSLLVFLCNYLIYVSLQTINFGEFDSFYITVKFYIFLILFTVGWLVGYGFSRSKYITIVWSVILLIVEIVLISKTSDITASALLGGIIPVLVYAFYIIYTTGLIRNLNEDEASFTWVISKRISAFALLLLALFIAIITLFTGNFKAIEKQWGGAKSQEDKEGKGSGESMTQKGKNGGVENKDQSKLTGSLSKDKQLLFVARLDNYFENSNTPNPLYFTSRYYTKFDTATQTFEIDDQMPYNDLFNVDPSKIPLYFKKSDPTLIQKSLATLNRKVVTTDVYNVNLSADTYLAPSTAFFCQPISVPKELKKQYRSAYTAKMWVSELNSAYFIYNPAGNRDLEHFQEQRFEKLREIENIVGPDKKFMDYYTYMPSNAEYRKISELAKKVTQDQKAPIDKIIAIRDYFLSKDEFNQPLYQYSDNPGIPGMPSASKLNYFLFENRKGYCAYYAGATLFMLRSLGIPSRVAAGFLTTDRSSKNPGWYWFYQDQAHAWVQVYFQGYGWIDFDTTIPDVNTQQASQPDGTPPTDVPVTYLVIDGTIVNTDTIKKRVTISSINILYHDSEFVSKTKLDILTDVSLANISLDTTEVKLSALAKGMHVTAVSHAEVLKNIYVKPQDSLMSVISRLSKPIPIDELKIIPKEEKNKQKDDDAKKANEPINWLRVLYTVLFSLLGIFIVVMLSPLFIWLWLNAKAKRHYTQLSEKGYHINRALLYYLNQMGYVYQQAGPGEFARQIDKQFGTNLKAFNASYQKIKYSKMAATENDSSLMNTFYAPFISTVKKNVPAKTRLKHFLNIYNTLHYFSKPKIS